MPPAMAAHPAHLQVLRYSPIGNTMSVANQPLPRCLPTRYLNFIRKGPLKDLPTRPFRIFRIAGAPPPPPPPPAAGAQPPPPPPR